MIFNARPNKIAAPLPFCPCSTHPYGEFCNRKLGGRLRLDWWTNRNLKFRGLLELRQKAFVMWVLLPQMLRRAHLPKRVLVGAADSNQRPVVPKLEYGRFLKYPQTARRRMAANRVSALKGRGIG